MEIRSAQNVGRVLISREKSLPTSFVAIFDVFSMGCTNILFFVYFPWWANRQTLLLSTLGREIGIAFRFQVASIFNLQVV